MKKIIHIITGLGSGGAENMLLKLLQNSNYEEFYHEVISLTDLGSVGPKIESLGVKVYTINLSIRNMFKSLFEIRRICKSFDIIDTWLYHSDLIGFIVAKILLNKKLIWNIRHSNLNKLENKKSTLAIVRLNSLLSKYVDSITYNSNDAKKNHLSIGYAEKKSVIIYNGFDIEKFKPNKTNRLQINRLYNLNDNQKIFITIGRWYIQKDYPTLLRALYELKVNYNNFILFMCGENLDNNNDELMKLIKEYELQENILLLGRRDNVSELLSAADIYISSSLGESFSNAIGEAMCCGLPCVVTDVGDSKYIVGCTGRIVEAKQPTALANGIEYLITNENIETLGALARKRIEENFQIKSIVDNFQMNYLI